MGRRQNILEKVLLFSGVIAGTLFFVHTEDTKAEPTDNPEWEVLREPATPYYNGTFLGIEGNATMGLLAPSDHITATGVGAELTIRTSILMHLFDSVSGYRFGSYAFSSDGESIDLQRHTLFVALRAHPLFMFMLRQDYLAHVLSSLYVDVGATVSATHWATSADEDTEWGVGIRTGVGLDLPLGIPDGTWSLWFGLGYERTFLNHLKNRSAPLSDINEHIFQARLSWRFHNLRFGHLSRPDEFELKR